MAPLRSLHAHRRTEVTYNGEPSQPHQVTHQPNIKMNKTFRIEKPSSRRRAPTKADTVKAPSVLPSPAPPALTAEQLEDVLRQFDLNPRYGPFVGIDRMKRWERAEKFGLDPPPAVRKLLQSGNAIPQRYRGSLW